MSESRVVVLDCEHGAERVTATRVAGLDRWCVGDAVHWSPRWAAARHARAQGWVVGAVEESVPTEPPVGAVFVEVSTGRRFVVRWTSTDEVALRCEGAEIVVLSRPLLHLEFVAEVGHE